MLDPGVISSEHLDPGGLGSRLLNLDPGTVGTKNLDPGTLG